MYRGVDTSKYVLPFCIYFGIVSNAIRGANEGGVGVSHPPIISTPGPSCNLMGISRSRSGPVCIEFVFITPIAASSSVGAVIYML